MDLGIFQRRFDRRSWRMEIGKAVVATHRLTDPEWFFEFEGSFRHIVLGAYVGSISELIGLDVGGRGGAIE